MTHKLPRVQAGYIPARLNGPLGSKCGECRDFIRITSECVITDDAHVSAARGVCILYVRGRPHEYGRPLRLLPKPVVGYLEGPEVPTSCWRCRYYDWPGDILSTCAKVGDDPDDRVEAGGCCNLYEVRRP